MTWPNCRLRAAAMSGKENGTIRSTPPFSHLRNLLRPASIGRNGFRLPWPTALFSNHAVTRSEIWESAGRLFPRRTTIVPIPSQALSGSPCQVRKKTFERVYIHPLTPLCAPLYSVQAEPADA
jgi:hypothetical protein